MPWSSTASSPRTWPSCRSRSRRMRSREPCGRCWTGERALPRVDPHLLPAQLAQVFRAGPALEAHLVVLRREVGRALALQEGRLLALEIGGVLGAMRGGADVDHVAEA